MRMLTVQIDPGTRLGAPLADALPRQANPQPGFCRGIRVAQDDRPTQSRAYGLVGGIDWIAGRQSMLPCSRAP